MLKEAVSTDSCAARNTPLQKHSNNTCCTDKFTPDVRKLVFLMDRICRFPPTPAGRRPRQVENSHGCTVGNWRELGDWQTCHFFSSPTVRSQVFVVTSQKKMVGSLSLLDHSSLACPTLHFVETLSEPWMDSSRDGLKSLPVNKNAALTIKA